MSGWRRYLLILLSAGLALFGTSGCSRSMINYQVAESIGTVGEHENNEPVETPKMQAEREMLEAESELEESREEVLSQADRLAAGYQYEAAIAMLESSDLLTDDERMSEAVETYQADMDSLVEYNGDVVHLNFPNLIVDTSRAIDDDAYAQTYEQNLITLSEFEGILNQLYENGYVLIDIHSLADETDDGFGDITMSKAALMLPSGKKPLVLSVENLNYASVRNGDGVAVALALDEDGEVGAVYTDENGSTLIGAYDVVPVLEQFIAEHPDFSYQGARGIIGLSGEDGAFGYQVEDDFDDDSEEEDDKEDSGEDETFEDNRETVQMIAQKLRDDGWTFASEGYSYTYMNDLSYDDLTEDITRWEDVIGTLVGDTDTIIYPYGSEVDYDTEKSVYLVGEGFHFMVGLWASEDFLEVDETYLRQTRRAITGYVLDNYASYFASIFNVSEILDNARG